jgi:hypothetical protein
LLADADSVRTQLVKILEMNSEFATVRMQGYFEQKWNDMRVSINATSDPALNVTALARYDRFDADR